MHLPRLVGCAISRFDETIKPDIIVSNGSTTIRVHGEVIYRNLLSEKDVETIITMCYAFTDGKALITVEGEKWRRYATGNSDKETALKTLVEHIGMDLRDGVAFGDDK